MPSFNCQIEFNRPQVFFPFAMACMVLAGAAMEWLDLGVLLGRLADYSDWPEGLLLVGMFGLGSEYGMPLARRRDSSFGFSAFLAVHGQGRTLSDAPVRLDKSRKSEIPAADSVGTESARFDNLTGLPNRDGLAAWFNRRAPSQCVLFVLGLDDFQVIRTVLGEESANQCLKVVSARLSEFVPAPGVVARTGLAEFALLFDIAAPGPSVEHLGFELLRGFDASCKVGRDELAIKVSVGSVDGPIRVDLIPGWLFQARAAMAEARSHGGGTHLMFAETMLAAGVPNSDLLQGVRDALANQELTVHYQPVVDLASGVMVALDAHPCWPCPDRGWRTWDGEYLEAEAPELAQRLGECTLSRVCRDAAEYRRVTGRSLTFRVKVSARQLLQSHFLENLMACLHGARLNPAQLTLDLPGCLLVAAFEAGGRHFLDRLKATGVRIAIDQPGLESAGLISLTRLPIDSFRIDQRSLFECDAGSSYMVFLSESIFDVAAKLGLESVVRGIETADEQAHLLAMGCFLGQGSLFGLPVSLTEILARMGAPVEARYAEITEAG